MRKYILKQDRGLSTSLGIVLQIFVTEIDIVTVWLYKVKYN
jgi:hypothetical protein